MGDGRRERGERREERAEGRGQRESDLEVRSWIASYQH